MGFGAIQDPQGGKLVPNAIYISSHEPDLSKLRIQAADWIPCRLYFKWMVMKDGEQIGFSCLGDGSEMRFQKYAGRQTSEHRVLLVLEAQKSCVSF